uniref:Uncharacterized protein n=1 Tax=uncultured bacterium BLR17 TaxID=506517 RepID=C0INK5_9BACT|nr:hypothetical protein AKSOIL_0276 [uncultured bacterium BLR17]
MAFNEANWICVAAGTYKMEHGTFTFMKKELHMNGTLWQIWQHDALQFSSTRKHEFLSKADFVLVHGFFIADAGIPFRQ